MNFLTYFAKINMKKNPYIQYAYKDFVWENCELGNMYGKIVN